MDKPKGESPAPEDSVVKAWISELPYKMQVVLLSALRGCDGIPKEDISKTITRAFRAVLLHPAVEDFNDAGMFMSVDADRLAEHIGKFAQHLDHYPNHFIAHLIHAMEIVGYRHPDPAVATFWFRAYILCCSGMHLNTESIDQLERRLAGDFGPE